MLTRDAADPYGASRLAWRADEDTAAPTYRFTGKEDDPLSGAIAIGARHYLPELGRWASPDPHFLIDNPDAALTTPGEANPYSYVGGNPVTFTDPTGRKGLAHGSENRPGVLDNFPDSPNSGFDSRMAAVAHDRALAEHRGAQLASMAYGVLDTALTGLDWAMTASDVADFASMAAGLPGAGFKLSKQGGKLALRQARKAVRKGLDDAVQAGRKAAERLEEVTLSRSKYPGSSKHVLDARSAGHPTDLTISRPDAPSRRSKSMKGQPRVSGKDRDEYPPAFTKEGGDGASVRPIDPGDNRGAGACIGNACRGMPDGTKIRIAVTE